MQIVVEIGISHTRYESEIIARRGLVWTCCYRYFQVAPVPRSAQWSNLSVGKPMMYLSVTAALVSRLSAFTLVTRWLTVRTWEMMKWVSSPNINMVAPPHHNQHHHHPPHVSCTCLLCQFSGGGDQHSNLKVAILKSRKQLRIILPN